MTCPNDMPKGPGDEEMALPRLDEKDRAMILAHYYRAMVTRADVWRVRMDATTNWAIGTSAGLLSFVMSNPEVPHYVVFLSTLLSLGFLQLEARRLSFYHLWQGRVLMMERGLIRSAMGFQEEADSSWPGSLPLELGTTIPTMPRAKSWARRMRRLYLMLFFVQFSCWLSKLSHHPTPTINAGQMLERAGFAFIPGPVVFGLSIVALVGAVMLAWLRGGLQTPLPD